MSPYTLPEGNVAIAFSGGRTSAYMLHQILEANGALPDRVVVSFQNTGREMPETLDFVQECGERWGVRIVWLEYRPEAPRFEVVSHNSASRNGEPFEALIRERLTHSKYDTKTLPNVVYKYCTGDLKVHTQTRYLRSLGWERWTAARGLRADEPTRIGKANPRERWVPWHPLAEAGVAKADVTAFWARQPFDLRLANIAGRTPLGNCDGCFLKSEANRAAFVRDFPDRAAWWADMERLAANLGAQGEFATFIAGQSYAALGSFVERQGDWLFNTEGALCQADGGECFG